MNNVDVLSQLMNHMPVHVYWKDIKGRYLGCNLAQAQSFGLQAPEALIGKTDVELFDDDECASSWVKNDQEVIEKAIPMVFEEIAFVGGTKITGLSV